MAAFVGLDLAWVAHNETGVCIFEGTTPEDLRCTRIDCLAADAETFTTLVADFPGSVVAAVDAPLLVTTARRVEREIGRRFGRFKASAHTANLDLLTRTGRTAGMELAAALERHGFELDPDGLLRGGRDVRYAIEVYPHAIHVGLFRSLTGLPDLAERLPYKQKRGRRVAGRRAVMCAYQDYLRAVLVRDAPGVLRCQEMVRLLAHDTTGAARGRELKRHEDRLDAATCALAAWLIWRRPGDWEVLGGRNYRDGCVVTPVVVAGGAAGAGWVSA